MFLRGDIGVVSSPTLGFKQACSSPNSSDIQANTTPKSTDRVTNTKCVYVRTLTSTVRSGDVEEFCFYRPIRRRALPPQVTPSRVCQSASHSALCIPTNFLSAYRWPAWCYLTVLKDWYTLLWKSVMCKLCPASFLTKLKRVFSFCSGTLLAQCPIVKQQDRATASLLSRLPQVQMPQKGFISFSAQ